MKITETIERECCDERKGDLKQYRGDPKSTTSLARDKMLFCVHCGQIWIEDRRMDAAGSSETYFRKVGLPP